MHVLTYARSDTSLVRHDCCMVSALALTPFFSNVDKKEQLYRIYQSNTVIRGLAETPTWDLSERKRDQHDEDGKGYVLICILRCYGRKIMPGKAEQ